MDINSFCTDFNAYLNNRYGYKRDKAYVSPLGTKIAVRPVKKFDFYLRFKPHYKPWPNNTLVIARIGFDKARAGNGSDFIHFLLEKSELYEIENIGIEQANKNSSEFAKKMGLSCIDDGSTWCGSVSEIKEVKKLSLIV